MSDLEDTFLAFGRNTRYVGNYPNDCNKGGPHKALWDYRGLTRLCPEESQTKGFFEEVIFVKFKTSVSLQSWEWGQEGKGRRYFRQYYMIEALMPRRQMCSVNSEFFLGRYEHWNVL